MQLVHTQCAGLDVHKKTVVAFVRLIAPDGTKTTHLRTFRTMTADLLTLLDWLLSLGVTHVAMESTGEFWKPVYNLLESQVELLVVNAQHIKHVPGRKTDVKDAEWLAELLAHGLLRASFVPPAPQRALRDLTRQRSHLVRERASVVNRMQKVLEWANIKLAGVATDITGVSARAMLEALVAGQTDLAAIADLARGRMRAKRAELEQALRGSLLEHHVFMIARHLEHIDFLDEEIASFDEQIQVMLLSDGTLMLRRDDTDDTLSTPTDPSNSASLGQPGASGCWSSAAMICDAVPGIGPRIAETIVAELGTDMSRFLNSKHASAWAGVAPGQHESAGKRKSSRIGKGNRYLRSALIQAAHAAVKKSETFLAAYYRRLAGRRGKQKAIVAVAHKILVIVYTLLKTGQVYQERGALALDEHQKDRIVHRLERRIAQLGYKVNLEPITAEAA
jgi:transposase